MTDKKGQWGPWIDWYGGECPVPDGVRHQIEVQDGDIEESYDSDWNWRRGPGGPVKERQIIRYRVWQEATAFDPSKPCTTRDGREVTLLEVCPHTSPDPTIRAKVKGAVMYTWWNRDGTSIFHPDLDLINVPEKVRGWVRKSCVLDAIPDGEYQLSWVYVEQTDPTEE